MQFHPIRDLRGISGSFRLLPSRPHGRGRRRTLTNLYNERPTWLELIHQKLDAAVFAAYGWDPAISDDDLLRGCWSWTSNERPHNDACAERLRHLKMRFMSLPPASSSGRGGVWKPERLPEIPSSPSAWPTGGYGRL
jgi:hypothetical protein